MFGLGLKPSQKILLLIYLSIPHSFTLSARESNLRTDRQLLSLSTCPYRVARIDGERARCDRQARDNSYPDWSFECIDLHRYSSLVVS